MGLLSFLKYTFIIFAAHLATSCGAQFENHCSEGTGRNQEIPQDRQCPGRDSNWKPPEYKSRTLQLDQSVR
jgi:hypothetical protein